MRRLFLICFSCGLLGAGCESIPSKSDGGLPELLVESVEPDVVLPGTWIHVHGKGFVDETQGTLTVFLGRGESMHTIAPERIDDTHIKFQIVADLFSALGGAGSSFAGTVRVQADYTGGQSQSHSMELTWTLHETLKPRLELFTATEAEAITYLGSDVQGEGTGFLLEGEGETHLRLSGTFTPEGEASVAWSGSFAVPAERRDLLDGPFPVEALGISPGVFEGDLTVVNVHAGELEVAGNDLEEVTIELGRTFILGVEPPEASRGQWIRFTGRGFVAGSARTAVRLEGTFTARGGDVTDLTGVHALEIFPDVISGDLMQYVLRVTLDGQGQGLGAVAGTLEVSATPVVYSGADSEEGIPMEKMTLIVGSQKQVVYLNYLPGFTDALRDFGLRNVETHIRDRILEVCNRDYKTDQSDGANIEWRTSRPTDFVEYSVLEVGGKDPNNVGLIGLDNSMSQGGKDIGNLYFDDVVGGMNADAGEEGHYAFGGVFISSYLAFSPKAPKPMGISSEAFDKVFGPFMSSQGGKPVEAGEYPDGSRSVEIGEAIQALGSMVGNTVTHEIGHTLGMTTGPRDLFHNLAPADNQIMDAGFHRDFEERAELNKRGPACFTDENWDYLRRILPK